MNMDTNDGNTLHQCVVCDVIFQQLDDLEKHNKIHVKEEKIDVDEYCHVHFKEEKIDDVDGYCHVHFKEEKIDDIDEYCHNKIHVLAREEKTDNIDEYCHAKEEKTDNIDDFCVKEEKTDDIEPVHQCNLCKEEFKSDTDLEKHCKIHVEEELKTDNGSDVVLQSADSQGIDIGLQSADCQDGDVGLQSADSQDIVVGLQSADSGDSDVGLQSANSHTTNYRNVGLQSADSHASANLYKCDVCVKSFSCVPTLQTHIKGHAEYQFLSTIGLDEHYDLGSVTQLPFERITNRLVQCIVKKFPNSRNHLSIIRALHEDCITFTDKYIQNRLKRRKIKTGKLAKCIKRSEKIFKLYNDFVDSPFFSRKINEKSSADTNTTNSVDVETQTSVDETLTNLSRKNIYLLNKVSRDKVTIFRLKNQLQKITKALVRAKANNKKALAIKENGFSRTLVGKK